MNAALMILGMVFVTWGVRAAPFLIPNLTLPPRLLKFLNCIPAATLAALISESILSPVVEAGTLLQPELLAACVCLVLGFLGSPMLLTVVVGMGSFWVFGLVL